MAQVFGGGPAGRLLFVQQGDLWIWERGAARPLGIGYTWHQPRWSPDGSQFAYVYRGNSFSDIFVTDVENRDPRRLTTSQSRILDDNEWKFRPTWSPDGRQIAFSAAVGPASARPWVMSADGTGRRPIATGLSELESVDGMSWSPDGSTLAVAFFSGRGPSQLALLPLNPSTRQGARVITTHPGGAMDPAWSPDGRWLAYAVREGRGVDIYAARADGSSPVRLTNAGQRLARAPAWSPDGGTLAYLSGETGAFEVWLVDMLDGSAPGVLEPRNPRQLTRDLSLDAPSGITWTR